MDILTKLKYYDKMNSIKLPKYKIDIPFNIINDDNIKLTYKNIKLKYIDGKNYFIKIKKSHKKNYTPEETALYLARKEKRKKKIGGCLGGNMIFIFN